jgi:hypothetical protein
LFGFDERALQDFVRRLTQLLLRDARHFRETRETRLNLVGKSFRTDAQAGQQRRHDPVVLRHKRAQDVQWLDLLMIVPGGNFLCCLNGFLRFQREFVEAEHAPIPIRNSVFVLH